MHLSVAGERVDEAQTVELRPSYGDAVVDTVQSAHLHEMTELRMVVFHLAA
jgi:hypothetical protein